MTSRTQLPDVSAAGTAPTGRRTVPILMYHEVSPHAAPAFRKYAVTPRAFAAQMRWLAATGHVSVGLDVLVDAYAGRTALPERPVVITFDDGFQGCADHAVPALRARRFTAVFYLVAGLIGQTSRWLVAERGLELPLMDWTTVRELAAAGFHCGAHTMTHPRLAALPPDACRDELQQSRQLLEDGLGREVRDLAYPFGSWNGAVRAAAAEAGYRSACTVQAGLSAPGDDLLALRRVPVSGHDSLLDFVCRLRGGHNLRETTRAAAGRALRRLGFGAA